MVIVRTIVDEPLPLYAKAFHQRFLALCHYVQISSTAVFLAEMAAGNYLTSMHHTGVVWYGMLF